MKHKPIKRKTRTTLSVRWLLLIPVLLLGAQLFEVLTNVETKSGFYTQPRTTYHLLLLLVAVLGSVAVAKLVQNKKPLPSDQLACGGMGFILCASTGAVIAYACFLKLWNIIRIHPFHHFFMSAQQLTALGFKHDRFQLEFIWALVGFAAAAWFFSIAMSISRHGTVSTNRYFALVPVLWYCIRAISRYITAPINANDSVAVISVLSLIVLGWAWFSIVRYFCFLETALSLRYVAGWSFAALCITVAFSAPNMIVEVARAGYADAVVLTADAVAAVSAAFFADRMIFTAKEIKDVQQQKMD